MILSPLLWCPTLRRGCSNSNSNTTVNINAYFFIECFLCMRYCARHVLCIFSSQLTWWTIFLHRRKSRLRNVRYLTHSPDSKTGLNSLPKPVLFPTHYDILKHICLLTTSGWQSHLHLPHSPIHLTSICWTPTMCPALTLRNQKWTRQVQSFHRESPSMREDTQFQYSMVSATEGTVGL